jgi:hypothetical protein
MYPCKNCSAEDCQCCSYYLEDRDHQLDADECAAEEARELRDDYWYEDDGVIEPPCEVCEYDAETPLGHQYEGDYED